MQGQTAAPVPASGPARGARAGQLRAWAPPELLALVAACLALAALSAAVLPTVPSYDPWSWVVWGREVFDPHLSFTVGGGPSWKPLPVCFTAIYGLFGSFAPTAWVITARAGGLLGVLGAYRLGSAMAGRVSLGGSLGLGDERAGWPEIVAGLLAAAGVVLTHEWVYYMYRGTSEPMLIAACLWTLDRHLAGRRGSAFLLLVAASLIRPEAWPFILAYGVWIWLREPRLRALVVAGWASIPFLWFVPPWVGSGQPFLAASHAKSYNGHLGSDRFLTVLGRGATLQLVPVLVLGLIAALIAWRRGRDRVVLGLAACGLAWWVLVVAMTLDGYPGLDRFFLPAAGVACVLGGAAIVALGRLAARWVPGSGSGRTALITAAVVVALVAVLVPFSTGRVSEAWAQRRTAARAVTRLNELTRAVAAVGGHHGVFPCRTSYAAVNHGVQTALAWKLHVTLGRVGTSMRNQGVLFVGPWDSIDGQPAHRAHGLTQLQLLARTGAWRVYRVTAPGASTRCVGG